MWHKKEKAVPETKKKEETKFTEKDAEKALNATKDKAKELIEDEKSMKAFLGEVDKKFNAVTGIKDKLSDIPLIVSLVHAYIKGEYRTFPVGSLIGLVGALIYFVSPVDAIPDVIPGIGYMDDMMVLGLAVRFAYTDLQDYKKWLDQKKA